MNLLMPDIEADLDLWLSVLADNELDATQRSELVKYLESSPEHWRSCAVALMDQQVVEPAIRSEAAPTEMACGASRPLVSVTMPVQRRVRIFGIAAAVLAAVAASFFTGRFITSGSSGTELAKLKTTVIEQESQLRTLAEWLTIQSEVGSSNSLASLYPNNPMLIEIENTLERVLYLTDRPVSDAMLQSFAAAGHVVDVNPYKPRLMTSWMRSLSQPVLAVEVYKSRPVLLAQGVSQ